LDSIRHKYVGPFINKDGIEEQFLLDLGSIIKSNLKDVALAVFSHFLPAHIDVCEIPRSNRKIKGKLVVDDDIYGGYYVQRFIVRDLEAVPYGVNNSPMFQEGIARNIQMNTDLSCDQIWEKYEDILRKSGFKNKIEVDQESLGEKGFEEICDELIDLTMNQSKQGVSFYIEVTFIGIDPDTKLYNVKVQSKISWRNSDSKIKDSSDERIEGFLFKELEGFKSDLPASIARVGDLFK
jgi:hypothetical protein